MSKCITFSASKQNSSQFSNFFKNVSISNDFGISIKTLSSFMLFTGVMWFLHIRGWKELFRFGAYKVRPRQPRLRYISNLELYCDLFSTELSPSMDSYVHRSVTWSCTHIRHYGLRSFGRLVWSLQDLDFWPCFHFTDRPFGGMHFDRRVGLYLSLKFIFSNFSAYILLDYFLISCFGFELEGTLCRKDT